MVNEWLGFSWTGIGLVVVSTVVIFMAAIVVIRISGLRALSKMSSFDFVVTVALGSIVATAAATSTSLWNAVAAFAMLLAVQRIIAILRQTTKLGSLVDNEPLLLMDGTEMLDENLKQARVTRLDVFAKLREANVTDLSQVLAVVLETTGDISVLHGQGPLESVLLTGVRSD